MYKSPCGAVHEAKRKRGPTQTLPTKGGRTYTKRSGVCYTKFHTRSEAEFITRSYLHEAKRSSLHEVPYTQFITRSEAELIHEVPYVFPTILCLFEDWDLHLRWGICHDTPYSTGDSGA